MRRHMFAAVFLGLPLATVLAAAQSSSAVPPARAAAAPAGIEVPSLDRSVDACTDFYQFVCGGWMAANPMPPDRQRWGRFNQLQDQNFTILRRILETPATGGDRKKASDYYAACMDEAGIEAKGERPLEDLNRIAAITGKGELPALVAHLQSIGVNVFFRFGSRTDLRDATRQIANVDQGGLGLPDRDYYLKTDARSLELKQKYQSHVQKMLGMLKTPPAIAETQARAVLDIETHLADAALDRTARRDPATTDHMMSRAEWQALTPDLDWSKYLAAAGAPAFSQINVSVPGYLKSLNALITSTSLGDLKAYLAWQLVNASAQMLPKAFADADFDFFSRTLGGQQEPLPRWQRCVTQTDE